MRHHKDGGLGRVSIAVDQEVHREVAFKEILPEFAQNSEIRARFLLEGEVTGKLEHPGIVPVYGLGQFPDGQPFYAMRFISGQSLREAIEQFHSRGPTSGLAYAHDPEFRQLIGRLIDVCQAIEYAHSKGVLHRDLKPQNVMLGKYGETLVVDWGLAKKIDSGGAVAGLPTEPPSHDHDEPSLRLSPDSGSAPTIIGRTLGTPKYMSPEQARGEIDKLGHATDVYALGAILFSVLTNQPPIGARPLPAGPEKLTPIESVQRAAAGKFPRPTAVNPAAPRALEAVCLRAMSLRTESRYRTAKLLADDLQAWLDDQPVSAMIEPFSIRAQRWMKQHRTAVTTTATAVFVTLIALSVLVVVVTEKNKTLESASSEIRRQSGQIVGQSESLRRVNEQLTVAKTDADKKRHQAEQVANLALQRRAEAEDNLKISQEQGQLALSTLNSVIADLHNGFEDATEADTVRKRLLTSAVGKLEKVSSDLVSRATMDRHTFTALILMADTMIRLGGTTRVDQDLDLDPFERSGPTFFTSTAEDAQRLYLRAVEIAKNLVESNPSNAQAQSDLADACEKLGDAILQLDRRTNSSILEKAAQQYLTALEIRQKLATLDPSNRQSQRELSFSYQKLGESVSQFGGRRDKAFEWLQKSLEIFQDLAMLDPTNGQAMRDLAVAYDKLASSHFRFGERNQALKWHEKSLVIRQKLATDNPTDAVNLYDAARVCARCVELLTTKDHTLSNTDGTERQRVLRLALDYLKESLAAGYDDFVQLRKDEDLAPLHGLPEFEALFAK